MPQRIRILSEDKCSHRTGESQSCNRCRKKTQPNTPQATANEGSELPSLLLGAGFVPASLIILPALAQRVGIGTSLTIALRGAPMRIAHLQSRLSLKPFCSSASIETVATEPADDYLQGYPMNYGIIRL
jgi:hypothetical protein